MNIDSVKQFYFVRHGETPNNRKGLLQFHANGCINSDLTDLGEEQALTAGAKLSAMAGKRFYMVVSPYVRASRTGYIMKRVMEAKAKRDPNNTARLVGYQTHDDLRERFGGALDCMPYKDFMALAQQKGLPKPNTQIWDYLHEFCLKAENSVDLTARVNRAICESYVEAQKLNAELLIVGHYGALNTFKRLCLCHSNVEIPFKNASPYLFANESTGWQINEV